MRAHPCVVQRIDLGLKKSCFVRCMLRCLNLVCSDHIELKCVKRCSKFSGIMYFFALKTKILRRFLKKQLSKLILVFLLTVIGILIPIRLLHLKRWCCLLVYRGNLKIYLLFFPWMTCLLKLFFCKYVHKHRYLPKK